MSRSTLLNLICLGAVVACFLVWLVQNPEGLSPRVEHEFHPVMPTEIHALTFPKPATEQALRDQRPSARSPESDPFVSFASWRSAYAKASPAERPSLAEAGVERARERREAMIQLIRNDPAAALRNAVGPRERRELPAAIRAEVERVIDAHGDVFSQVICHLDDAHDHADDEAIRFARIDGTFYRAFFHGDRESLTHATGLPLHGIALDGFAAFSDKTYRILSTGERDHTESTPHALVAMIGGERQSFPSLQALERAASVYFWSDDTSAPSIQSIPDETSEWNPPPATGSRSLLYVRVDFPDQSGSGITVEEAEQHMAELAHYLGQMSHGRLTLDRIEIVPEIVRLPYPEGHYIGEETHFPKLRQDTIAALRELSPGYEMRDYDFDIIVLPPNQFTAPGAAFLGSRGIFLNSRPQPTPFPRIILHELGHNLGLAHARSVRSSNSGDPFAWGLPQEYGDPADAMGTPHGMRPFNIYFKHRLGWLNDDEWVHVSHPGVFRLFRHDLSEPAGLRGIRFGRSWDHVYWIDMQEHSRSRGGVAIRRESWRASTLLDMTPATTGFDDYPLVAYRAVVEPRSQAEIEVVGWGYENGHAYADVSFQFTGPPTLLTSPEGGVFTEGDRHVLTVEVGGGGPFTYQWTKDGIELPGENHAELVLDPALPEHSGVYNVRVANEAGSTWARDTRVLVYAAVTHGGEVAAAFPHDIEGAIHAFAEDAEGRIYLAGDLITFGGQPIPHLIRLRPDGELDQSFDASGVLPGPITVLALNANGSVLAGSGGRLARLQANGSIDPGFALADHARAPSAIRSVVIQPNGGILVAGGFKTFDGQDTGPLVRLHADGTFDRPVGAHVEPPSYFDEYSHMSASLLPQPDGKVLAITFLSPGWMPSSLDVHRLLPDGDLDPDFTRVGFGKFTPAGFFPHLENGEVVGYWAVDGHQVFLQRFDLSGERDLSFQAPNIARPVSHAIQDQEGCLYIFARDDYSAPLRLYRMNADGTFDGTFRCEIEFNHPAPVFALASGDLLLSDPALGQGHPLRISAGAAPVDYQTWAKAHGYEDPQDDPGGAGIPNLLRYAFGMDPLAPDPDLLPSLAVISSGDGASNHLALTFRQRQDAIDLDYQIEASTDLLHWARIEGEEVPRLTTSEAGPGILQVTIADPLPLTDAPARFLRVRVTLAPAATR